MGHLHTKAGEHDMTVSLYIIRLDQDTPKIMLHRHKKLGRLMQFGGHVEQTENLWDAVQRELREECGYSLSQLSLLQPPYDYLPTLSSVKLHPHPVCILTYPAGADHYHTDICFAFVTHENPKYEIARGESREVALLNEQEFISLPKEEIFQNVREVTAYIFKYVLPEWRRVRSVD